LNLNESDWTPLDSEASSHPACALMVDVQSLRDGSGNLWDVRTVEEHEGTVCMKHGSRPGLL
jgi:hypothetical protein